MEEEKGNAMLVNNITTRIKHHQLQTRTRTRTLRHQHAHNAFTYVLQIHIEQAAVQPVEPDVTKTKRAEESDGG